MTVGACYFCFTGFGHYHEPQCPLYGIRVDMIERVTIDGEEAYAAYVNKDFEPVDKDKATLVKLIFDNGKVMFMYPCEMSGEGAEG